MYLDLIIIIVLIALAVLLFRKFSSFVYAVAIIDIFLRIMTFIKNNVPVPPLKSFIGTYFPSSIEGVINSYSSGIINTIIMWGYTIIYVCFLYYTIKVFIRKKK